ncbi:hypothetical protein AAY81_06225 [Denitrobacterium detoxificans]|uniref:Fido domain-containing protein n=1 Tax=Denitrobacterium detoxificans TaxID=79604 RepID=A0A172RYJ9_9ACTN|nr:hypothetical protein [Denitrobacterium detoxificans]ANE22786.1 hypothetical protein AAY81_06225 [Denitrobacterium detoxificans]SEO76973.1 hypothetical protein SAMN02910314_01140 [Denitrobacterium detoxificans]
MDSVTQQPEGIAFSPAILLKLCTIHEHRGAEQLACARNPEALDAYREATMFQSALAATRMEGMTIGDTRLRCLAREEAEPQSPAERFAMGYLYVWGLIEQRYASIRLSPGTIQQLHRDMLWYEKAEDAGEWKDETETPAAIRDLCREYQAAKRSKDGIPMQSIFVFYRAFTAIAPFERYNTSCANLLLLLLLCQEGYTVGLHVSLDAALEGNKRKLGNAAKKSKEHAGDETYAVRMLETLLACYETQTEYLQRMGQRVSNEARIRAYFDQIEEPVTKRAIMDANPSMSQKTVERILQKMQDEGAIRKIGAARATRYKRR